MIITIFYPLFTLLPALPLAYTMGSFLLGKPVAGTLNHILGNYSTSESQEDIIANEHWFTQPLNHFSSSRSPNLNIMWKQRYFVNTTYWNGDGSPIFIQIGGEGPIKSSYVNDHLYYTKLAKDFSALVFAIEHRFYGKSQPAGGDLSLKNLRYLSSQQALADLARFTEGMVKKYAAPHSPVIVFGCSYPGALSAWFRLKYPHLVAGSISSSAPLHAKLDFYEYLEVVASSLEYWGTKECVNIVQNATNTLHKMLVNNSMHKKLIQDFNLCTTDSEGNIINPLETAKDQGNFISTALGNIMLVVQYNNMTKGPNVSDICTFLNASILSGHTALSSYAALNEWFLNRTNNTCVSVFYNDSIKQLRNTAAGDSPMRQWIYQQCQEFGYFATTSSLEERVFGPAPPNDDYPLSKSLDICRDTFDWFDYNEILGNNNIDSTNNFYGSTNISSSNILFVHGSLDPYHVLGVTSSRGNSMPAILIPYTAHCADILMPKPSDPPQLQTARDHITKYIKSWMPPHCSRKCLDSGTCISDDGDPVCVCSNGNTGTDCQNIPSTDPEPVPLAMYALSTIGGIIGGSLLLYFVIWVRSSKEFPLRTNSRQNPVRASM